MRALLLGKPLHGDVRRVDPPAPERLTIEVDVIEERKSGGGLWVGVEPRRSNKVVYLRAHSGALPKGLLVYVRRGYEPQPEDVELVREAGG